VRVFRWVTEPWSRQRWLWWTGSWGLWSVIWGIVAIIRGAWGLAAFNGGLVVANAVFFWRAWRRSQPQPALGGFRAVAPPVDISWSKMPDAITPIRAVRMWGLQPDHSGFRLSSIGMPYLWTPGPQEAVCGSYFRHRQKTPYAGCGCGFWGLRDPDAFVLGLGMVVGVVEMWGRVLCGTRGWRAQFARPIALLWAPTLVPEEILEAVASAYGIPVLNTIPELTEGEPWTSERSAEAS
jgi:hypothetical protein